MKESMYQIIVGFLALTAATLSDAAPAQSPGTFSASVGPTRIAPDVDSGNLSPPSFPGTRVEVGSDTRLTGTLNYRVTDRLGLALPVGFGFRHQITGDGAIAGVGKVAETRVLPVTLLAQYHFPDTHAGFRPYVGAGASYVRFYKEKGSDLLTAFTNPGGTATGVSFESKFAPTFQLGATYDIDNAWYVEGSYAKTILKTRATLTTGQTIDVELNPNTLAFHLGYKF